MAGKSMPDEPVTGEPMSDEPVTGEPLPAERTKAVANVHRMLVEVIEVMEIAVAIDDGWTVDVGRTSIA
jgi:hypothetical protein